ncbi:chromosome segregation protein SMC [Bacillus sp. MYb209]|uniref:chromosome segregation protein SMC n=1 Tax=Bacillus sp. MYb209 TaxID=1848605 RepID=UPI000CFBE626|nr:chromosome segregation protein SMC [Bacillus sp. MYb209]PQZ45658.1 chromosome segregation protein SMC [Bacillus sp. MYb209]
MATERELELAKQILAKVTAMDNKLEKLDGRLDKLDGRLDKLDNRMDSSEGIFKGLQATFENGFRDIHTSMHEIIEINKNRKSAKEIVEGIAGNGK